MVDRGSLKRAQILELHRCAPMRMIVGETSA
jgi:hypothetical protein